jgi:hypothetical protein
MFKRTNNGAVQLVLDSKTFYGIMRMPRGSDVNDKTLAVDVIREVGS